MLLPAEEPVPSAPPPSSAASSVMGFAPAKLPKDDVTSPGDMASVVGSDTEQAAASSPSPVLEARGPADGQLRLLGHAQGTMEMNLQIADHCTSILQVTRMGWDHQRKGIANGSLQVPPSTGDTGSLAWTLIGFDTVVMTFPEHQRFGAFPDGSGLGHQTRKKAAVAKAQLEQALGA